MVMARMRGFLYNMARLLPFEGGSWHPAWRITNVCVKSPGQQVYEKGRHWWDVSKHEMMLYQLQTSPGQHVGLALVSASGFALYVHRLCSYCEKWH